MGDNTKQIVKSGDDSNNVQAQTVNINNGITYSDAKEIALDVFEANFLKLGKEAYELATERVKVFTDKLINKLKDKKIDGVNDPGFQSSLYEAQKNYAKNGDDNLGDISIDILIERLSDNKRNLKQIVLDESLSVIGKLTSSQLDTLTIVFLLKYSIKNNLINNEILKNYLLTYLKPFIDELSKENSLYQHLEYSGCGSIQVTTIKLENMFFNNYKGLFFNGFSDQEFKNEFGQENLNKFPFFLQNQLIIPCLNNNTKFQLGFSNKDLLEQKLDELIIKGESKKKFITLFDKYLMSKDEVKEKIKNLGEGYMEKLFDIWDNSSMKSITLTSVGIAIAQANFKKKTGITIDLNIWIKE